LAACFPLMKFAVIPAVLALVSLPGCGGGEAVYRETTTTIEVLSLPRGCVVEMNGEYLGGTPVKIDIPSTADGRWRGGPSTEHRITVSTPNNRSVETKKWRGGDPIPRRVLFRPPYAHLTAPVR